MAKKREVQAPVGKPAPQHQGTIASFNNYSGIGLIRPDKDTDIEEIKQALFNHTAKDGMEFVGHIEDKEGKKLIGFKAVDCIWNNNKIEEGQKVKFVCAAKSRGSVFFIYAVSVRLA